MRDIEFVRHHEPAAYKVDTPDAELYLRREDKRFRVS